MINRCYRIKVWAALLGVACGSAMLAVNGQDHEVPPTTDVVEDSLMIIEGLDENLQTALLQNHRLEEKVANLLSSNRQLAEGLVAAKKELEDIGVDYKKTLLHLELLSKEAFDSENGLEERLIKAASNLRLIESEKDQLADALVGLSAAVEAFMKNAVSEDAQARLDVEKNMRAADEALGLIVRGERLVEKTLEEAKVITVKKDFNLLVVDVGKKQGLLLGTPVKIHRKDRVVGSAIVIDVRDAVSGAIILEMNDPNDSIMVDDAVRVDPKGVQFN